jgi:hypothetical protein
MPMQRREDVEAGYAAKVVALCQDTDYQVGPRGRSMGRRGGMHAWAGSTRAQQQSHR